MATTKGGVSIAEQCETCGRETPHEVSVEILTESNKGENAAYSREPYRVSTCRHCDTTTTTRMNNE